MTPLANGGWGCRWRWRPATSTATAASTWGRCRAGCSLLPRRGDGRFHLPVSTVVDGSFPRALAAADFNADGHLDLAVGLAGQPKLHLTLGNGTGTFQTSWSIRDDEVGFQVFGIALADFNEAARLDLVASGVAFGRENADTFLGTADGTFRPGPRLATTRARVALRSATSTAIAIQMS